jgi:hypothetical protein
MEFFSWDRTQYFTNARQVLYHRATANPEFLKFKNITEG